MGFFDIFKKREEPRNLWEITDKEDFIMELLDHLEEKTACGEKMHRLNEQQRIFYVAQTLEAEVNNGGFDQFFYNSSGAFANELVEAFTAIGAHHTAEICRKAVEAFGSEVPTDREKRQDLLDELEDDEVFCRTLEACDDAFYEYKDNLTELNFAYVMNNRLSV